MTADEIRTILNPNAVHDVQAFTLKMMIEIAAQLAEHNALLREVIRTDDWGRVCLHVGGSVATSVPES